MTGIQTLFMVGFVYVHNVDMIIHAVLSFFKRLLSEETLYRTVFIPSYTEGFPRTVFIIFVITVRKRTHYSYTHDYPSRPSSRITVNGPITKTLK